jgi:hypothetical protein
MALIACPDCGKEVSSSAAACNGCGAPIAGALVAKKGDTVPYSDQEVAVMLSKKKSTSHILHLLLCIPTVGLWVVVWILVAASNGSENARIDKKIAKGKKIR